MRKVLLATTALVAMSATAAQADLSISGSGSFEINDTASSQAYTTDGSIVFKGTSTTDSGLTLSAVQDMKFEGAAVNDSYIDIAGSFGSLRMGNTDDALDRNDGALPHNWDIEGNLALQANVGGDQTEENISFISPNISGVTLYGSTTANGTTNGLGISYSNGPVSLVYQAGRVEGGDDANDADETMVGASFTMGAFKVGAGHNTAEDTEGTKSKTNEVGATYTMGDITLVGMQSKSGAAKYNSVGISYSIAPGFSFSAESAELTGNDDADTETYMGLHVSF
jgi:hypothetical protein